MSTDTGTPSLAEALAAAQAEMPAVGKDAENPQWHSRFTSLDNLIAATRPVLNQHGFAIVQQPVMNELGHTVLRTTLLHGPSGESLSSDMPLFLSKQDMQGFGATITYGRRYAWAALLGIASEEDTDGNVPGNVPGNATPAEKPAAEVPVRLATKPQKAKMGILVKELAADQMMLPPEYAGAEDWTDVLRMRLNEEYGVTTRTDLTVEQASELIDWLEAQKIPF